MTNGTKSWMTLGTTLLLAACAGDFREDEAPRHHEQASEVPDDGDGDFAEDDAGVGVPFCGTTDAPENEGAPCDQQWRGYDAVADSRYTQEWIWGTGWVTSTPSDELTIKLRPEIQHLRTEYADITFETFALEGTLDTAYVGMRGTRSIQHLKVEGGGECRGTGIVGGYAQSCDVTELVRSGKRTFRIKNYGPLTVGQIAALSSSENGTAPTLDLQYERTCQLGECSL